MDIDIVVIGVNSEATLGDCLKSILKANYPQNQLHLIYADGGSTDNSVAIAESFPSVKVVHCYTDTPTPGLGRNRGWKEGGSPWIQFLDSDTLLDPEWLNGAVSKINEPDVVGIRGNLHEIYPERSLYNWIGDLEWNDKPGLCTCLGGDALIKRSALEKVGGYKEDLIVGEDPELSFRLIREGGKILHIDKPMALHDLGMTSLRQYWKRAYRTGYGFAAIHEMHKEKNFWKEELQRVIIRAGGFWLFFLLALLFHGLFIIPALFFLFKPLLKFRSMAEDKHLSNKEGFVYALHCSLVVLPQFQGVLRYYWGALTHNPLRNKASRLKTIPTQK